MVIRTVRDEETPMKAPTRSCATNVVCNAMELARSMLMLHHTTRELFIQFDTHSQSIS